MEGWGDIDQGAYIAGSEAGSDISEATLRFKLMQEYDPSAEEIGVYYHRMQRYCQLADANQLSYDLDTVMRLMLRAEYRAQVHGMSPPEAIQALKSAS